MVRDGSEEAKAMIHDVWFWIAWFSIVTNFVWDRFVRAYRKLLDESMQMTDDALDIARGAIERSAAMRKALEETLRRGGTK
jgi:hypothetical protein